MRKCNSALFNCILFISISVVTCTEEDSALSLTNNNIAQKSQNATFNNTTVPVSAKSQEKEKVVVIGEGGVTVPNKKAPEIAMEKLAFNNNSSVKSNNNTINSKNEKILNREESNPSAGVEATSVVQNTSKIKLEDSMKNMNPPKLGREGVSEEVKPKVIVTKLGLDNFPTPETPTLVKEPSKTISEPPKILDKPKTSLVPTPKVEQQKSLQPSIPTTDNHTLTSSNNRTENKSTMEIEKPLFEVPKKNDGLKSVPRKGVLYPFDNVTTSSTTTVRPRPKKPLLTEASDDMPPVVGPPEPPDIPSMEHYSEQKVNRSADYIVPIVAVILSVPLVAIILSVLYKRGAEWWQHRHYRRMDFLIEGMYNN